MCTFDLILESALDFETRPLHTALLKFFTSEGEAIYQQLTFHVKDVNEAPTVRARLVCVMLCESFLTQRVF